MKCPNCTLVNGVPFCQYYGFTPNQTAVDACARRREGKVPLDYNTLKKRWFPKKGSKEAISNEDEEEGGQEENAKSN